MTHVYIVFRHSVGEQPAEALIRGFPTMELAESFLRKVRAATPEERKELDPAHPNKWEWHYGIKIVQFG